MNQRDGRISTVVGYSQSTLNKYGNITLVTAQFCGTGADERINLLDLTCPEDNAGSVTINTITEGGAIKNSYQWTRNKKGRMYWVDTDAGEEVTDPVYFNPGDAFWVQCDVDDDEVSGMLKSAGQVNQKDVTVELNRFGNITLGGNATPVQVDLCDFLCPEDNAGSVTVNTVTEGGAIKNSYQWTRNKKGRMYWVDTDAGEEVEAETVFFQAGESFWIQCDVDDDEVTGQITFPGVELN